MRHSLTLAAVLVTTLSSLTAVVEAAPTPHNGVVHIPLTPVSRRSDDMHPEIQLQQHINRAHQRLARMSGTTGPTTEELQVNLIKRLYYLPKPEAEALQKRYQGTSAAHDALKEYRNSKRNLADIIKIIQDEKQKGGSFQDIIDAIRAEVEKEIGAKLGKGGKAPPAKEDPAKETPPAKEEPPAEAPPATGEPPAKEAPPAKAQPPAKQAPPAKAQPPAKQAPPAKEQPPAKGPAKNTGFSPISAAAAKKGGLTKAKPPTDKNSIGLDIEANDVGYIGTIKIGTPPRDFKLLMDSGSADMWVGAEVCKSLDGGDCGPHTFLGPKASSTFKDSGKPFAVKYGSGSVQGNIITDNISIAQGLDLRNHVFGVANVESPEFTGATTSFDGLIGLAQSKLAQQKTLTPVEALAKNKVIAAPITSYKISRIADQKNDGQITFGGLDQTKFDPKTLVTVKNVNNNGFWESDLAVKVDGKAVGLAGRTAILDTGTTLIIAPPADAEAFHAAIPGSKSDGKGGFIIPCTTNVNVAFTIGGRDFSIDPRDLTFLPAGADLQGDCLSGVASGQIGGAKQWLVGDVFLKNVYFSHDVAKNTVSLANLT